MSDEDYGDDDFDDYEFEDFEDSETEDKEESVDISDPLDENPHLDTVVVDLEKGEEKDSTNLNQDNLDSTDGHNREVICSLKLNEPAEIAQTEISSLNDNNNTTDNINRNKDVGANTLVHSISTELRRMMMDEERQNKENIRACSPVRVPESRKGSVNKKNKKNKNYKKSNARVRSPVSFSTLLTGEEGLTDNSSSLLEGGTFTNNMSSIETSVTSPGKVLQGPGSEAWKSQLDSYSNAQGKCVDNEKIRTKNSRFIQSQVSQDSKLHRSTVERQLQCALQQLNSYRKENTYLTKMIDTSTIQSEFNTLRVKNEEQSMLIKQLIDEKRSLLFVQRNQEKSLLETEKEKEFLPEQEHINQKKMNAFQKKVKTLRDNLYHYQVKTREEMNKNKNVTEQNTKLKVKLKALMIAQSVAEQLKRDQLGLTDDQDESKSNCNLKFESLGVGDEATANEETIILTEKEESFEELRTQRNKLKSIVENQRASFRNQLVVVQTKLERSLVKRKELEDELVRREKEMRAQIFSVKELNKTCEELTKSNLELLEASSLYSKKIRRTVQGPPPPLPAKTSPRPPPQSFTHRPSPVMSRPKEPMMAHENTFLTGQSFEDSQNE